MARARPARCRRSCFRPQAAGAGLRAAGARRHQLRSTRPARPASPPPTSPSPTRRREQFAAGDHAGGRRSRLRRRAGRGRRADPLAARLPRRAGRADQRDRRRGRSRRCAPRSPRAIEQRKRGDALAALIARVEDAIAEGASIEEVARADGLTWSTTPPITATGQVVGGTRRGSAPAELRPLLARRVRDRRRGSRAGGREIAPNQRFALVGIERVEPAAPPPLAQIRDAGARRASSARARSERARAVAEAIAARINGGTPAAQAFAAGAAAPAAGRSRSTCAGCRSAASGQQVPPPLITLFSIPQGRARMLRGAERSGLVHRRPRAAHARRRGERAAADRRPPAPSSTRTASEEIAQQFARAVERGSEISRDEAAIARARRHRRRRRDCAARE